MLTSVTQDCSLEGWLPNFRIFSKVLGYLVGTRMGRPLEKVLWIHLCRQGGAQYCSLEGWLFHFRFFSKVLKYLAGTRMGRPLERVP